MKMLEELMVMAGISLDIFAVMECQGSLVAKIEKKRLALMCLILVIGQALTLECGRIISVLLCQYGNSSYEIFLEKMLAAVIFGGMGVRLLLKAWKNERITEHRKEEFHVREFLQLCVRNCIFTLFIGIAFGFLRSSMVTVWLMLVVLTMAVTILGMYTGYRLGFEHKVKAYLGGGILLIAAGVEVLVRYL